MPYSGRRVTELHYCIITIPATSSIILLKKRSICEYFHLCAGIRAAITNIEFDIVQN